MLTIKEIVVKINQGISYEEAETLITQKVEFHTNAALKAASEEAKFFPISTWNCEPRGVQPEVNKQSILNAYPKENIT